MKGYLSVREISYKWNISERWVSKLAQDGRIPGGCADHTARTLPSLQGQCV